jgi:hypothetical protein
MSEQNEQKIDGREHKDETCEGCTFQSSHYCGCCLRHLDGAKGPVDNFKPNLALRQVLALEDIAEHLDDIENVVAHRYPHDLR